MIALFFALLGAPGFFRFYDEYSLYNLGFPLPFVDRGVTFQEIGYILFTIKAIILKRNQINQYNISNNNSFS